MTKKTKSLFNFEELETQIKECDTRMLKIVWFAVGFMFALIVMFIALLPNAK